MIMREERKTGPGPSQVQDQFQDQNPDPSQDQFQEVNPEALREANPDPRVCQEAAAEACQDPDLRVSAEAEAGLLAEARAEARAEVEAGVGANQPRDLRVDQEDPDHGAQTLAVVRDRSNIVAFYFIHWQSLFF